MQNADTSLHDHAGILLAKHLELVDLIVSAHLPGEVVALLSRREGQLPPALQPRQNSRPPSGVPVSPNVFHRYLCAMSYHGCPCNCEGVCAVTELLSGSGFHDPHTT